MGPLVLKTSLLGPEKTLVDEVLASGYSAFKSLTRIDPAVLRDLLIGHYGPIPITGVQITNVECLGIVDLDNAILDFPLKFYNCIFTSNGLDAPFLARDATLRSLLLRRCVVTGGLVLDRAQIRSNFFIRETTIEGSVRFPRAHIGGTVDFSIDETRTSHFKAPGYAAAIYANGAICQGDFILDGVNTSGREGLSAESMKVAGTLSFRDIISKGKINISNARIGLGLYAEGAHCSASPLCLLASGSHIGGDWLMSGETTTMNGAVVIERAVINGRFAANDMVCNGEFIGSERIALNLSGSRIANFVSMVAMSATGEVRLRECIFESGFGASHIKIANTGNVKKETMAINAEQLVLFQDWFMTECSLEGQLNLRNADLRGNFRAGGVIKCDAGKRTLEALHARGLTASGDFTLVPHTHLQGSLTLDNARVSGDLNIIQCKVDGILSLEYLKLGGGLFGDLARIQSKHRFAIVAKGAKIKGDCRMRQTNIEGAISMMSAEVDGLIDFQSSKLVGRRRVAFHGVDGRFSRGINFTGRRVTKHPSFYEDEFYSFGAIILDRSVISGEVRFKGARLRSGAAAGDEGQKLSDDLAFDDDYAFVAVSLEDARLEALAMPNSASTRPIGRIVLKNCKVGRFDDHEDGWHTLPATAQSRIELEGFTYERLQNPLGVPEDISPSRQRAEWRHHRGAGWRRRERWLKGQSDEFIYDRFFPSPWIELANKVDQQGHHATARSIRIARRRHEAKRGTFFDRILNWILYTTARYGHSPMRTVFFMAFAILFYGFIWYGAMQMTNQFSKPSLCINEAESANECLFLRTAMQRYTQSQKQKNEGLAGDGYPAFNPLAFSFDIFLPLLSFGYQDAWSVNTSYRPISLLMPSATLPRWLAPADTSRFNYSPIVSSNNVWHERQSGRWIDLTSPDLFTIGGVFYLIYIIEMLCGLVLTSIALAGFSGLLTRND